MKQNIERESEMTEEAIEVAYLTEARVFSMRRDPDRCVLAMTAAFVNLSGQIALAAL